MIEEYNAIWHGYIVTFCTDTTEIELKVDKGCRGWFPVTVCRTVWDTSWYIKERPSIEVIEVNYP